MTTAKVARARRLWPLFAVIVVAAASAPWHSHLTVDDRSFFEMVEAISEHGLPYREVEGAAEHPELRARWNLWRGGKLWSQYPPLYGYLAMPVYRLGGGVRALVRLNILLLVPLVLIVFAIAERLADERAAVAAAYATVLAAPVWTGSVVVSSFTLAIVLALASTYFALRAADDDSIRSSFVAGALGGAATATHLLAAAMAAGTVAALALASPRRLSRVALAVAGAALALAPVMLLNHVRFGTWNPVSYGPCVWRSCGETGLSQQSVVAEVGAAMPLLIWAVAVAVALSFARGPRRIVAVLVIAGVALACLPTLRERAIRLVALAYAFWIDNARMPLGAGFERPPDGVGNFLGPWVIKSAVQSTPLLAAAFLVGARSPAIDRKRLLVVCAPIGVLTGSLLLRADLPLAFALGYPFLHMRYLMFVVPLALILAVVALRSLPWRRSHLVAGVLAASLAMAFFLFQPDDATLVRRLVLLRLPLMLAAAIVVTAATLRGRRLAPWIAAAAAGLSVATTLAVDLRAVATVRHEDDIAVDDVARHTPAAFALVGYPREVDPVLALTRERHVEYADLYETSNPMTVASLVAQWHRRGLPIFAVAPPSLPPPPIPGLIAVAGSPRLYRLPPPR